MKSFLSHVACAYLKNEKERLIDYCFVFPNKRSGMFFSKYLADRADRPLFLPKILTISELVGEFSSAMEASRFEQLFILYKEYRGLSTDISEFDQFQFWGDILLNDFNDVDKYLVDARQLFRNVKSLKEINSNYLTPEQIEIINRYWGVNRQTDTIERFWAHVGDDKDNQVSSRFLKLWEILYDLYINFRKALEESGLCFQGMLYRTASEKLASLSTDDLPYRRYVFIGFNVLSTSELSIFSHLKRIGVADFYWDYNSPAFNGNNKASQFIEKYTREYPSKYDIEEPAIREFSEMEIIGIPSNIGQVKEAGHILSQMLKTGEISNPDDAINTAVVLPDEELFIPLIHSLPSEITSVNITMGYPMKHTSVAALIKNIVSMQLRTRVIKEEFQYYYEDIQNVLSHPLVRTFAPRECEALLSEMMDKRMFNLSSEYITSNYPLLKPVFVAVKNVQDADSVFDYTYSLVSYIIEKLSAIKSGSIEISFLLRYRQALEELHVLTGKYTVSMSENTFFHLLERAISSETVNFVGEPLTGLQIMGVLETRALDFDNIILLSMNERVFPRKHYSRSFIPDALRRGYGLSTIEFQESIYAYYFYRLLSRSRKVYMFYDARNAGLKSGEMSRYLYQLKYLYPQKNIKTTIGYYEVQPNDKREIEIKKTPDIMNKLNAFRIPGSGKSLSASSVNQYINCPLSFYLEKIEGLNIKDDVKEYMDESTYGTIVHEVAEDVYKSLRSGSDEVIVTESVLNRLIHSDKMLSTFIRHSINKNYNKLGDNSNSPLVGESKVLADIILYFLKSLFREEKQYAPFAFIDGEKKMTGVYHVTPEVSINFTQTIDRIDRVRLDNVSESRLRIVDYKTGSDVMKVKSFDKIFDNRDDHRAKAILQLFLYCNFYAQETGCNEAIQPMIYGMKTINIDHLRPLTVAGMPIVDYRDYNEDFRRLMALVIEEMFDAGKPFVQASNDTACKYCKFTGICGR